MNRSIVAASLIMLPILNSLPAFAEEGPSAQEIIDKVVENNSLSGKRGRSRISMLIKKAGGGEDKRIMESKVAKKDGLRRSRADFLEPADVKGTVLLLLEMGKGQEDQQYLYLPNLRRTRQISGANKNQPFMGSDFTYSDMEYRDARSGAKKRLGDEKCGQYECFKVEVTPDKSKESDYNKMIISVHKEHFLPMKMELFDKNDKLLKVMEGHKIELKDDVWMLTQISMKNVQKGSTTLLQIGNVDLNANFGDNEFHPASLDK